MSRVKVDGPYCLALLIIIFLAALGIFLGFFFDNTYEEIRAKNNFLKSNCTILTSYLNPKRNCTKKCTTVYSVEMLVKYYNPTVQEEIETKAYNSFEGSYVSETRALRFIITHPIGSSAPCYYDSKDSLLVVFNFDHDITSLCFEIVGGGIMVAVFIFIVFALCRLNKFRHGYHEI
eukprot:TRINITY_DN6985_c0_g1_i1.p1 TRINITY_DN6985_c0_g1~~TRINITY_DN6985_c0_g1_i1.p1  ORF type:complete len:176 (+),score=20.61 TRINITY_DN6985_c0_g1_i1:273-800(+)